MAPPSTVELQSHLIPSSWDRPGDDPIFSLHAAAAKRAAQGEAVLNLTIGALMEDDGTLAVMPSVQTALESVPAKKAAAYAPIAGPPAFREAVIQDLFGEGQLADRSIAVATPGGTGAIHHAIVNFLEPTQALLTTSYYWGPYRILAEHTGRRVETFEMFDEGGRFHIEAFERGLDELLARQDRALIVLNTPCHNPTGYSLDESEWRSVAEILRPRARRSCVALLVDLAYAKFGAPSSKRWFDPIQDMVEDVALLVAWTVSKAFAQYGARVGSLVAVCADEAERERTLNALSYSCRGTWSNCNHMGMLAITELLTNRDLRERCDSERDRLRRLLSDRVAVFNREAERAGLRYPRYEGGFFVSVFTPDAEKTASHMRDLGVFVVPLDGAVRVALCSTAAEDVPRLVEALDLGVRAAG